MSKATTPNTDLRHDGLQTRFGMDIIKIHGFGHDWIDEDSFWPKRGTWWVICDEVDPETGKLLLDREVDMNKIVFDSTVNGAEENMNSLSKACMDYLGKNGHWNDKGVWLPNE